MSRSGRVPGEVLIALAAFGWGSAYPATAVLLESLSPIGAATWRGLASTVIILILLGLRGEQSLLRIERRQILPLAVLGILGGALFTVALNGSINAVGSSVSAFIVGSFPIVMVVTAPFILGEHLSTKSLGAVTIAVLGAVLLTRPAEPIEIGSLGFAVVGSLSFALYLQLARRWSQPYRLHPMTVAVVVMAALPVVSFPLQLLLEPSRLVPNAGIAELLSLLWLALPSGGLAHLAANAAVARLPAGRSSTFLFSVPLWGATIAVLLLGERLSSDQVVGGALIVAAIVIVTVPIGSFLRRSRAARD